MRSGSAFRKWRSPGTQELTREQRAGDRRYHRTFLAAVLRCGEDPRTAHRQSVDRRSDRAEALSRRLRIEVKERKPFALWQKDGKLYLIAEDGTVLGGPVPREFASLPLVVGKGAETPRSDLLALLGALSGDRQAVTGVRAGRRAALGPLSERQDRRLAAGACSRSRRWFAWSSSTGEAALVRDIAGDRSAAHRPRGGAAVGPRGRGARGRAEGGRKGSEKEEGRARHEQRRPLRRHARR